MKIEDFPNTLTANDKTQVEKLKLDLSFSDLAYFDNQVYPVKINTIDISTLKISGYSTFFNAFFENFKQIIDFKDVDLSNLNFLPSNDKLFIDFKQDLKIIPFYVKNENGEKALNNSSELIQEHDKNNEGKYDYLIIEPYTKVYLYHKENGDFEVESKNKIYIFQSLDLALKPIFELAITKYDFKTAETRKKIKEFELFFETDEMKQSLSEFAETMDQNRIHLVDFFNSGRIVEILENSGNTINPDDTVFVDEDEYYTLFNSIFQSFDFKIDESATFRTEYIIYKGYRFEQIHGQGTIYNIFSVS